MSNRLIGVLILAAAMLPAGCVGDQLRTPTLLIAQQPVSEEIGSTRNSRVAYLMPAGAKPEDRPRLVLLTGAMSDEEARLLKEAAPNVELVHGLDRAGALARAADAHAVEARLLSPDFIAAAPNLVWVHSPSAGVERLVSMAGLRENDRIVLTNSRGVHGAAIADHAMAMLLSFTRNLPLYAEAQAAQRWEAGDPTTRSVALEGKTMLVVGLGGIGTEIAQRAHGFGMRVIATRRSETPGPEYVEKVGKPADLLAMLSEADVVAICVPLTPETDRIFNDHAFEVMKSGAYLINVARGRVVDTEAMLKALRSGRLGGVCLDVTDPEPLPADHALWREKHVVITPHVSNDAELTDQRRRELFLENVRRFGAGEPLLNVVDKKLGY